MGKDLWVVSEYSDGHYDEIGMKGEVFAFEDFDTAKSFFRERIKKYAIEEYEKHKDEPSFEEEFAEEIKELTPEELAASAESKVVQAIGGFYNMLLDIKSDPTFPEKLEDLKQDINYEDYLFNDGKYYRGMLQTMYFKKDDNGNLSAHCHDYNDHNRGFDNITELNCFEMENPNKHYYFHEFNREEMDGPDTRSHYYIDLQKVT